MRTEDDLRAAFLALERHTPDAARVLGALSRRRARRRQAHEGVVSLELRGATRARSALAGDIPPLDLAAFPDREAKARGWMTWAAPAAAAAVVTALAISLAFARHTPGEGAAAAPTSPGSSETLPEYYAAVDRSGVGPLPLDPVSIRVGDDRTGKIIATVSPPNGETFAGLTAAADDRTFVAAAEQFPVSTYPTNPVAWYLLRLTPGGAHPVTRTLLPIPGQPDQTQVSAIALSPDGTELAVMYQTSPFVNPDPLTVALYSLATGKPVRTWTLDTKSVAVAGDGDSAYSNTALTWLVDGRTLAVAYGFDTTSRAVNVTIRTVDAGSPSGNLLATSKLVYRLPSGAPECASLQLTADGKTVLCGERHATKIIAYSVATGSPRLVYQLKGASGTGAAEVWWASPTGGTLLGTLYTDTDLPTGLPGLLTKNTFTPMQLLLHPDPDFNEIAF